MNQRLQEIMLAHGLHKYISEDCQHRMEMLAELIVRECVEYLKETDFDDVNGSNNTVVENAADSLKEHFGVRS